MKLKKFLFIIFLFLIYFIFYSFSYSYSVSNELENNLFRLHIVANSNSQEDQDLKLYIRNQIVSYLSNYNFNTKQELIDFINNNQESISKVVSASIYEKGFDYNFSIEIGNSFYPQKQYNNLLLPAGNYDGLQIKIGKAEGKNWWCVLFPPMCLLDSSTCELPQESKKILEENLSQESNSIISNDSFEYKFKFKIIDFFNNSFN